MKNAEEIRNKVVKLLGAELDRRVQVASERLPRRCSHNHRQPLDVRRRVGGEVNKAYNRISQGLPLPVVQTIGLCMVGSENPEEWAGVICEDPIDAKRCPMFVPSQSKEELFSEFMTELQNSEWVEANLPEVASLLWVLDTLRVPRISWWKKLWFRFARIKVEPVMPAFDPAGLLPPPEEVKRS